MLMIDILIIVIYLMLILYIGFSSRHLGGFREFAISHGHYGWLVICCTLSASFIGGGFSTGNAAKVFSNGMVYSFALLGFSLQIMLVALFIAPRIKSFPDAVSVGDIIEPAYGKKARVITGAFSMLICAGILGAQIGALGAIFNVFFGVSPVIGIIIGCGIIFFYSTIGGMTAVVRTDVLQFILLMIGMPLLFLMGVNACGGWSTFVSNIPAGHLQIVGDRIPLAAFASLFLVFLLGETLVPPYVQRLLLGRSADETSRGNFWSGVISAPFFLISGGVGLIALQLNPGISSNLALPEVIKVVLPVGLSGLMISGVISIVMSSADSFLNASSVALVQDVIKPLRRQPLSERNALLIARMTNLITGSVALLFAFMIPNVLDILIAAYDYWAPTVLVPLIAVLLGKKVSGASFYAAVIAGTTTTVLWNKVLSNPYGIQGFIMGTLLSFIVFTAVNRLLLKKTSSPVSPR
jgi:solute:Na+ symporter, SSS family